MSVDMHVLVYPGSAEETHGIVIEDFGDLPFQAIEVSDTQIAPAVRRWAVTLDSGELIFVNSDQLAVA